jgi:hypothetical protein
VIIKGKNNHSKTAEQGLKSYIGVKDKLQNRVCKVVDTFSILENVRTRRFVGVQLIKNIKQLLFKRNNKEKEEIKQNWKKQ